MVWFPCGKFKRNHEVGQEKVTSPGDCLKNEETTKAPSNHSEVVEEVVSIPSVCPWQVRCLTLKRFNTSSTHQCMYYDCFHNQEHAERRRLGEKEGGRY